MNLFASFRFYCPLTFETNLFRTPASLKSVEVTKFIPAPNSAPTLVRHRHYRDNRYSVLVQCIVSLKKFSERSDLQRLSHRFQRTFFGNTGDLCYGTILQRFVHALDTSFENHWQAYYVLKAFSVYWRQCYFRKVFAIMTVSAYFLILFQLSIDFNQLAIN